MDFVLLTLVPAVAIWATLVFGRISVYAWVTLFLIGTSVFTAEFFSLQLAGVTLTIDRLIFLCLAIQVAISWKSGELKLGRWEVEDYLTVGFLLWLAARTLTQPLGSIAPHQPPTLMHFINGYCIPLTLYGILRCSQPNEKKLKPVLVMWAVFGVYLSLTAFLEIGKMWTLVFPKFIADPELGIHFGRARGPMLQSVRLGICLLACWLPLIVFAIWLDPRSKARWVLGLATFPLFAGGVFFTYTRSIWIGLVFIAAMIVLLCLQGRTRRFFLTTGFLGSILVLSVFGSSLIAFKREYSAQETRESTLMRGAFAYVSIQMIKERPIAGFGFNQFNAANREFLSDRSTDMRLEAIRGYVHHNSFLSLLVDLGIVGFSLYSLLLVVWIRRAWQLWKCQSVPKWARGLALVALCLTGVHLIQMAFHEVSFSSIENGILFSAFGLVVGTRRTLSGFQSPFQSPSMDRMTSEGSP
jgi:O-antigen ligase